MLIKEKETSKYMTLKVYIGRKMGTLSVDMEQGHTNNFDEKDFSEFELRFDNFSYIFNIPLLFRNNRLWKSKRHS